MMERLTVKDVDLKDKRVFLRVDYNVPMDSTGAITNNQRIAATLPTIKYLLDQGVESIVIASHLGRPKGQVNMKYSLKPISIELQRLLGRKICFLSNPNCCSLENRQLVGGCQEKGTIFLLENLRFCQEEECTDVGNPDKVEFCKNLSEFGAIYVNDAFGAVHRAHSSIAGLDFAVKVAGLLVSKELAYFGKVLASPSESKPIDLLILGGNKVSDKIKLIQNMLPRVQKIFIGGGMAFTFLKVLYRMEIGASLYDAEGSNLVREIMDAAEKEKVSIVLPTDFITGDRFAADATVDYATISTGIKEGCLGMDIGRESIAALSAMINCCKSLILWNGPVGVFEWPAFENGTMTIVDQLTRSSCTSIVGGGDSSAAVFAANAQDKLSHVSTGGGATLELLEGRTLPGIEFLDRKQ